MEQNYISDDVFEQIKYFIPWKLTEEQGLLINKLIQNEELKRRYEKYGLCEECRQPSTGDYWCKSCNSKRFQQSFKNWTGKNSDVDKLIQTSQLNAKNQYGKLEWIEYDRFENVEYIAKGGFGKIHKADWKDGYIMKWNYKANKWDRCGSMVVALKCLNNSKEVTSKFLNEVGNIL
jgi:hypothetical protein